MKNKKLEIEIEDFVEWSPVALVTTHDELFKKILEGQQLILKLMLERDKDNAE